MNREETEDMARFILDVRAEWGVTVLMVEHDMGMVMDLSDHVVVLNFGQVIAQARLPWYRPTPKSTAPTSARATWVTCAASCRWAPPAHREPHDAELRLGLSV